MAKFAYNNIKNTTTSYTAFELNCDFQPRVSYEENVNPHYRAKTAEELANELETLMSVCKENIQYAQELQKYYYDKHVKSKSYATGDKVWLNSKYIKTRQNCKLEYKFFGPFRVLHPVGNLAYKLEWSKRWRIYDIFQVSLLEQNTTRKGRVDEKISQLEFEKDGKSKEYKVDKICKSAVYAKESESG